MVEVIGLRVRILCVQTESDEALNHPVDHGYHLDGDSSADAL